MRGQSDKQLVFIYLLAHADADGVAQIIQSKIADDTGIEVSVVCSMIHELMSPDPLSRTPVSDGRRLEPLDYRGWGWKIVNHAQYRGIRDEDTRRKQNREAQARHKDKHRSAEVSHGKPESAHTDTEADTDTVNQPLSAEADVVVAPLRSDPKRTADREDWADGFRQFWDAYPMRPNSSKKQALKVWMGFMPKDYSTADDSFSSIMDALVASKREWENRDADKIPHHVVWLRRELWRNDAKPQV